jgi:signal peptidase I
VGRFSRRLLKPLALAFLLVVILVGLRLSAIQGWWYPITVAGPSMIPTLWGPSRSLHCDHCGWSGRVAEVGLEWSLRKPCFRCGNSEATRLGEVQAGDRIRIDRAAFLFGPPSRDDLVAIQKDDGTMQVKRVVGVAGDTVVIDSRGSVFVNDLPWQPLSIGFASIGLPASAISPFLRNQVGIEVYSQLPGQHIESRLQRVGETVLYQHRNVHNSNARDRIRDDNPANAQLRRWTHPVDHLFLAFTVFNERPGAIAITAFVGNKRLSASIPGTAGQQQVLVEINEREWRTWTSSRSSDLRFSNESDPTGATLVSPDAPLAITFRGTGQSEIEMFWLGRAIRFDPPASTKDAWLAGVTVQSGSILVFGDNAPASEDSRMAPSGVPLSRVIGRVIPWSAK